MLQDRLEDYIEVDVGKADKIDPAFIIEEKPDFLIIGDVFCNEIPNLEIQSWLLKYWENTKTTKKILKAISGFYITQSKVKVEPHWVEFINDNIKAELIFPPILRLKLDEDGLSLEKQALDLIKNFCNDFIKLLFNHKKRK